MLVVSVLEGGCDQGPLNVVVTVLRVAVTRDH